MFNLRQQLRAFVPSVENEELKKRLRKKEKED